MSTGAVSTVKPKEELRKLSTTLPEWREYDIHEVYYVEDNQEIIFIPGYTKLLRRKCVYDKTSKKLLVSPPLEENVKRVKEPAAMKELDKLIQHPIRSFQRGIFIRRLHPSTHYYYLLEVMHGHDIPRVINPKTGEQESKYRYGRRKQQYLNMIFKQVISQGP